MSPSTIHKLQTQPPAALQAFTATTSATTCAEEKGQLCCCQGCRRAVCAGCKSSFSVDGICPSLPLC